MSPFIWTSHPGPGAARQHQTMTMPPPFWMILPNLSQISLFFLDKPVDRYFTFFREFGLHSVFPVSCYVLLPHISDTKIFELLHSRQRLVPDLDGAFCHKILKLAFQFCLLWRSFKLLQKFSLSFLRVENQQPKKFITDYLSAAAPPCLIPLTASPAWLPFHVFPWDQNASSGVAPTTWPESGGIRVYPSEITSLNHKATLILLQTSSWCVSNALKVEDRKDTVGFGCDLIRQIPRRPGNI